MTAQPQDLTAADEQYLVDAEVLLSRGIGIRDGLLEIFTDEQVLRMARIAGASEQRLTALLRRP